MCSYVYVNGLYLLFFLFFYQIGPAITIFVTEKLGKKFVEPPPFDLAKSYLDSTATVPLIFVLSPGADPMSSKYTQKEKIGTSNPPSIHREDYFALSASRFECIISDWWNSVPFQNGHLYVHVNKIIMEVFLFFFLT